MGQGSNFGRRGGRSQSGSTSSSAGSGRASPSQKGAEEPGEEEQSSADPVQQALLYSAGTVALVVVGLVAGWGLLPAGKPDARTAPQQIEARSMSAPAGATDPQGAAEGGNSSSDSGAKAAVIPVKQTGSGVSEQQRTAAMKFFGFYHLAGRARADYCARHGVDMAVFTGKLRQSQAVYHARATEVVRAAGLTEEKIYADSRAELAGHVAKDMEKVGAQLGMGAAGGCQMMSNLADKVIPSIDFAKIMPDDHRALMGL